MADEGNNLTKQPTAAEIRQAFDGAEGGISASGATTLFVAMTFGILLMIAVSALWGSVHEGDMD